MSLAKRIAITLAILAAPLILGLLITYQVFQVDWISMMEIQPSFRPMEDPLPLPAGAVPVQGAAFVPGVGSPENPVAPDESSVQRGAAFYAIQCGVCHGAGGAGDGPMAAKLNRKPANLTAENTARSTDGDLFVIITNGIPGIMPPFVESLTAGDRWDVINYVRSLGN